MKKWYLSWTIWFNILLLLIDTVNALNQIVPLPAGFLTSVGIVGNLLLRFKTTQGVKI